MWQRFMNNVEYGADVHALCGADVHEFCGDCSKEMWMLSWSSVAWPTVTVYCASYSEPRFYDATSRSVGFAASEGCSNVANLLSHWELRNITQRWENAKKYCTRGGMRWMRLCCLTVHSRFSELVMVDSSKSSKKKSILSLEGRPKEQFYSSSCLLDFDSLSRA